MSKSKALLKDILSLTKDGEWGKGEASEGLTEMLVIRGADFSDVRVGNIREVPRRFIPSHIAHRKLLQPGDILIETAGGTRDQPTGRTVFLRDRLFSKKLPQFTCASFSRFLRVNRCLADPEFVYWYLQFLYATGEMEEYQVQHTGVSRFQYTNFAENTSIPLPPLDEQRAISSILGALESKIESNQRMNETLQALPQSIFKKWFVDEVQSELPEARTYRALYDCADYINGAAFRNEHFSTERLGLPVIKIGELKDGITAQTKFCEIEREKKYRIASGEVLFSWSGSPDTSIDTFIWCDGDGWLNQHIFKIQFKRPIEKYFVYYLLRHLRPEFIEIARNKQTTGLGHVTVQDLKRMKTAFPPDNVLAKFNEIVEPLFKKLFLNFQESRTLAELRDALLPKLLSGEIRVKPT